jgi:hypothetical protein
VARARTSRRASRSKTYDVLEVIGLPVMEQRVVYTMSDGSEITDMVATGQTTRLEPGETITTDELEQHGQTTEDVEKLVDAEALREQT